MPGRKDRTECHLCSVDRNASWDIHHVSGTQNKQQQKYTSSKHA